MYERVINKFYNYFNDIENLDDNDNHIILISIILYSTSSSKITKYYASNDNQLNYIMNILSDVIVNNDYGDKETVKEVFKDIQMKLKDDVKYDEHKMIKLINKTVKYLNKYFYACYYFNVVNTNEFNICTKENVDEFVKIAFFDYLRYRNRIFKIFHRFKNYSLINYVDEVINKEDNKDKHIKLLLDIMVKLYHVDITLLKETNISNFNEYFYGLINSDMNITQKHILLLILLMYSEANYYSVFKDQLVINQINSVNDFIDKLLSKFIIDKHRDCNNECINEFKKVLMEINKNINDSFNIDCLIKIMDYLHARIKYHNFNYHCLSSFVDFTRDNNDNSNVFSLPIDIMKYVICEIHCNWQKYIGYLRYHDYYSGNSDIVLSYDELILTESFSEDIDIRVFNMLLSKFDNVYKKECRDIINDGRKQNHDVLFCNLLNINGENKEDTDKIRMEYIKKLIGSLGKCGIGIFIIPGSLFIGNKELELLIRKDTLTMIRCNKNIFYPKSSGEEYYYIASVVKYMHNPNVLYYINNIDDGYEIVNVDGKMKRIKTHKSNCCRHIPIVDHIVDELFDKGFIRMFS